MNRDDLIGQTYVDQRDSGTLVMKVVAVCPLVPTDVIVSPIGLARCWQRNADIVRALIEGKETPCATESSSGSLPSKATCSA